jgi:hypothetical protein
MGHGMGEGFVAHTHTHTYTYDRLGHWERVPVDMAVKELALLAQLGACVRACVHLGRVRVPFG